MMSTLELIGIHNNSAHEELVKILNEMYLVYKGMLDPIIIN